MDHRLALTLALGAFGAALAAQQPESPVDYTFTTEGAYMNGVKSLAELRGKPVLIEVLGHSLRPLRRVIRADDREDG